MRESTLELYLATNDKKLRIGTKGEIVVESDGDLDWKTTTIQLLSPLPNTNEN